MLSCFEQLLKRKVLLSIVLVCVLPFTVQAALKAFAGLSNNVYDWLPSEFKSKRELTSFVEKFGSAELMMVSWPGCTLDDERIQPFKEKLLQPAVDERTFFSAVITGPEVRDYFDVIPGEMSQEERERRMAGWIVSRSTDETGASNQTGLIVIVSESGAADRHAALQHVYSAADSVDNLAADDIKVAGPSIEGVAVDRASQANLLELNLASYAICLCLLLFCFRNIRVAALVLLVALFNQQLSLAIIHFTGTTLDSVLLLTANLTFVLSISVGIHFVNYYRDALEEWPPEKAAAHACVAAFLPTFLATITTALGLVSLTSSAVLPLARFGAYSAVAVILVAVTTIIYIAINFSIWPLVLPSRKNRETVGESSHSLGVLADAVQRSRWLLILLAFAGLAWGLGGARRLRTAVGLKHLVTAETRIIDDYNWLEAELGPLVPVEVILAMPKSTDGREMLEQFKQVAELHGALESVDESHAVISASTFVPVPPSSAGGIRQIAAAARFRKELFQNQEQLVGLGYLSNAEGVAHWRLTVRVPAMGDVDYGALLTELRSTVERTVTALDRDDVHITGGVPLIYQVQQQLLDDLLVSFLLAFGLVCIALVFVFRSVVCGLICMIPNLFPCAVVFGYLGWQDIRIEVGTVLTASAALGIAVDDTLHFITWFRQRVSEGGTQAESVAYAYRRCGAAMIQSTLVITLGLVVFAYSSFAPMQRFAWCMFALLAMALVADLAILPAILLSPLGRPFLPKPVWHPRSLSELAWRVAGPRDAVINFFINAPVALAVYWSVDRVPFVGHPSLLTICGWMSFLLPTITSYFGFLNGVGARKSGALPPAWPEGQKWAISAIVWGLICGVLSYACCVLVLHLLGRTWPDFALSKWQAVAVIGLLAAAMGYFFHSLAVARTHVLGGGEK